MDKRGARIIALDVVIALIRAETGNPTGLTGEGLDDSYDCDFEQSDYEAVWTAMDAIADRLLAKHERSLSCLPETKGITVYDDGPAGIYNPFED